MLHIEDINSAIKFGRVKISDHADEEAINDGLSISEVFSSILTGEIIEQYVDDKPYPSCLIIGFVNEGIPIHSV